MQVNKTLKI